MTDKAEMLTLFELRSQNTALQDALQRAADNFVKAQDTITHLRAQLATVVGALKWAAPLAYRAIEEHRSLRLKAGHNDISGTYKNGATWAGIHQSEVDAIERCRDVLTNLPTSARRQKEGG